MTTNWTVKLTQGNRELDLNTGRYQPDLGFVPPSVALTPLVATGTSANRYGGGDKVGERATDRIWEMTIRARGTTDAEVARAGADLASFLSLASTDPINPLYLEIRQNSDVGFDPLWGNYGTVKKFEIIHASPPATGRQYARGDLRATRGMYRTRLMLKPYAVGQEQILASATGGILEDTLGWKDGFSRGLKVLRATTNLFLNPIFGHGTWNNGWTNAASITDTENTDKRFVLFGTSSAKLVCNGASNRSFTESIDVGDTNTYEISCYAKLQDGGVISTTQINLFYGATGITAVFTAIGDDGFYRITGSVTGVAASRATGVILSDGYTVYVDGFQIEQRGLATALSHGDLMGNAWTGTPHASTSARTVSRARLKVSDTMGEAEGSFRAVWKADKNSADLGANIVIFEEDTGEVSLFWNQSNDKWTFTDGTNTAESAASSWVVGDVFIFHATYDPTNGLNLYIEGAIDGTDATYTIPTLGTYLYIGSTDAVNQHCDGTLMDFATFDRAMTAAEVLADYTNIVQLTDDNQRVGTIPWLWTKDGDNVVDNCLDSAGSTGAPHNNYSVMGGVPGSANAITKFRLQLTGGAPAALAFTTLISRLDVDEYFDPDGQIFQDYSGAAASDVTYCGGDYEIEAVDTDVSFPTAVTLNNSIFDRHLTDKEFECYTRIHDAGANLSLAWRVGYGLNADVAIPYRPISTTTTDKLYGNEKIKMLSGLDLFSSDNLNPTVQWQPLVKRTTGGPDNVRFDFAMLMARPLMRIRLSPGLFDGSNNPDSYLITGQRGVVFVESSDNIDDTARIEGDIVELVPEKINIMMSALTDGIDDDHVNTHTLTYTAVNVTPRYQVL